MPLTMRMTFEDEINEGLRALEKNLKRSKKSFEELGSEGVDVTKKFDNTVDKVEKISKALGKLRDDIKGVDKDSEGINSKFKEVEGTIEKIEKNSKGLFGVFGRIGDTVSRFIAAPMSFVVKSVGQMAVELGTTLAIILPVKAAMLSLVTASAAFVVSLVTGTSFLTIMAGTITTITGFAITLGTAFTALAAPLLSVLAPLTILGATISLILRVMVLIADKAVWIAKAVAALPIAMIADILGLLKLVAWSVDFLAKRFWGLIKVVALVTFAANFLFSPSGGIIKGIKGMAILMLQLIVGSLRLALAIGRVVINLGLMAAAQGPKLLVDAIKLGYRAGLLFSQALKTIIDDLLKIGTTGFGAFFKVASLVETSPRLISRTVDKIRSIIFPAIGNFLTETRKFVKDIPNIFSRMIENIKKLFSTFSKIFFNLIGKSEDKLAGSTKKPLSAFKFFGGQVKTLFGDLGGMITGFSSETENTSNKIAGVFGKFFQFMVDKITNVLKYVKDLVSSLAALGTAVVEDPFAFIEKATTPLKKLWGLFKKISQSLLSMLGFSGDLPGKIRKFAQEGNKAETILGRVSERVKELRSEIEKAQEAATGKAFMLAEAEAGVEDIEKDMMRVGDAAVDAAEKAKAIGDAIEFVVSHAESMAQLFPKDSLKILAQAAKDVDIMTEAQHRAEEESKRLFKQSDALSKSLGQQRKVVIEAAEEYRQADVELGGLRNTVAGLGGAEIDIKMGEKKIKAAEEGLASYEKRVRSAFTAVEDRSWLAAQAVIKLGKKFGDSRKNLMALNEQAEKEEKLAKEKNELTKQSTGIVLQQAAQAAKAASDRAKDLRRRAELEEKGIERQREQIKLAAQRAVVMKTLAAESAKTAGAVAAPPKADTGIVSTIVDPLTAALRTTLTGIFKGRGLFVPMIDGIRDAFRVGIGKALGISFGKQQMNRIVKAVQDSFTQGIKMAFKETLDSFIKEAGKRFKQTAGKAPTVKVGPGVTAKDLDMAKELARVFGIQEAAAKDLLEILRPLTSSLHNMGDAATKATKGSGLVDLNAELDAFEDKAGTAGKTAESFADYIEKTAKGIDKAGKEVKDTSKTVDKANSFWAIHRKKLILSTIAVGGFVTAYLGLRSAMKIASFGLGLITGGISLVIKGITRAIRFVRDLIGGFLGLGKAGSVFGGQLKLTQIALGATSEEVLNLAKDVGKATGDLTTLNQQLAIIQRAKKLGIVDEENLKLIEFARIQAKATGKDVTEVVEQVQTAFAEGNVEQLRNLGLLRTDLNGIIGQFEEIGNQAVNWDQLSEAEKKAFTQARAFEGTLTAIDRLKKVGLDHVSIWDKLRGAFNRIVIEIQSVASRMGFLGKKTMDLDGIISLVEETIVDIVRNKIPQFANSVANFFRKMGLTIIDVLGGIVVAIGEMTNSWLVQKAIGVESAAALGQAMMTTQGALVKLGETLKKEVNFGLVIREGEKALADSIKTQDETLGKLSKDQDIRRNILKITRETNEASKAGASIAGEFTAQADVAARQLTEIHKDFLKRNVANEAAMFVSLPRVMSYANNQLKILSEERVLLERKAKDKIRQAEKELRDFRKQAIDEAAAKVAKLTKAEMATGKATEIRLEMEKKIKAFKEEQVGTEKRQATERKLQLKEIADREKAITDEVRKRLDLEKKLEDASVKRMKALAGLAGDGASLGGGPGGRIVPRPGIQATGARPPAMGQADVPGGIAESIAKVSKQQLDLGNRAFNRQIRGIQSMFNRQIGGLQGFFNKQIGMVGQQRRTQERGQKRQLTAEERSQQQFGKNVQQFGRSVDKFGRQTIGRGAPGGVAGGPAITGTSPQARGAAQAEQTAARLAKQRISLEQEVSKITGKRTRAERRAAFELEKQAKRRAFMEERATNRALKEAERAAKRGEQFGSKLLDEFMGIEQAVKDTGKVGLEAEKERERLILEAGKKGSEVFKKRKGETDEQLLARIDAERKIAEIMKRGASTQEQIEARLKRDRGISLDRQKQAQVEAVAQEEKRTGSARIAAKREERKNQAASKLMGDIVKKEEERRKIVEATTRQRGISGGQAVAAAGLLEPVTETVAPGFSPEEVAARRAALAEQPEDGLVDAQKKTQQAAEEVAKRTEDRATAQIGIQDKILDSLQQTAQTLVAEGTALDNMKNRLDQIQQIVMGGLANAKRRAERS